LDEAREEEPVTSSTDVQVYAKLSALEFVLEVLLANELAHQPAEDTELFKQALVDAPGHIRSGPVDVDLVQAVQAETKVQLERFVEKLSKREAELRERISEAHQDDR
jgi:septum formation inhibitor MinC